MEVERQLGFEATDREYDFTLFHLDPEALKVRFELLPEPIVRCQAKNLRIEEHYTDTSGFTDHVFALCHFLGFRFAPRIRDLADKRLYVPGKPGRRRVPLALL